MEINTSDINFIFDLANQISVGREDIYTFTQKTAYIKRLCKYLNRENMTAVYSNYYLNYNNYNVTKIKNLLKNTKSALPIMKTEWILVEIDNMVEMNDNYVITDFNLDNHLIRIKKDMYKKEYIDNFCYFSDTLKSHPYTIYTENLFIIIEWILENIENNYLNILYYDYVKRKTYMYVNLNFNSKNVVKDLHNNKVEFLNKLVKKFGIFAINNEIELKDLPMEISIFKPTKSITNSGIYEIKNEDSQDYVLVNNKISNICYKYVLYKSKYSVIKKLDFGKIFFNYVFKDPSITLSNFEILTTILPLNNNFSMLRSIEFISISNSIICLRDMQEYYFSLFKKCNTNNFNIAATSKNFSHIQIFKVEENDIILFAEVFLNFDKNCYSKQFINYYTNLPLNNNDSKNIEIYQLTVNSLLLKQFLFELFEKYKNLIFIKYKTYFYFSTIKDDNLQCDYVEEDFENFLISRNFEKSDDLNYFVNLNSSDLLLSQQQNDYQINYLLIANIEYEYKLLHDTQDLPCEKLNRFNSILNSVDYENIRLDKKRKNSKIEIDCGICNDITNCNIICVTKCGHVYCGSCIKKMLLHKKTNRYIKCWCSSIINLLTDVFILKSI